MSERKKRLIVGISGASGVIYGIRALETLRELGVETHLVISKAAEMTLAYESELTAKDLRAMADKAHALARRGAAAAVADDIERLTSSTRKGAAA